MSIDQIAAEALRLPPSQRAVLAESLWESLSDPFEAVESDESSTIALAAERDRHLAEWLEAYYPVPGEFER